MEAKEKAKELVDKMKLNWMHSCTHHMAKRCATICVDEIILAFKKYNFHDWAIDAECQKWEEVKKEIELI